MTCVMCGGGGAVRSCPWTGDPLCHRCAATHNIGACLAAHLAAISPPDPETKP